STASSAGRNSICGRTGRRRTGGWSKWIRTAPRPRTGAKGSPLAERGATAEAAPISAAELSAYAGEYASDELAVVYRLALADGKLTLTAILETTKPSFCSSPWIFGAPQSGFSSARRRIRPRTSSVIFGRPPRGRDRQRQYSRRPVRCQPTTVSGFTMTRTSAQREQMRRRVVQKSRSTEFKGGRGRLRLSTAT